MRVLGQVDFSAEDFPEISTSAELNSWKFPSCGDRPLGFYPIVHRAVWLDRLLPLGVSAAQLRIKDLEESELEEEIHQGIEIARPYKCRLFINDHWRIAIRHGAYGVHLGQEDLAIADVAEIHRHGLRLGVSTHSYSEMAVALGVRPSYIAIGPVYSTTLKEMKFAPQGLEKLKVWRHLLPYPVVAIGGITLEKAEGVYRTGVDGIAVASDITQAQNPEGRTRDWLRFFDLKSGADS